LIGEFDLTVGLSDFFALAGKVVWKSAVLHYN
jgi:hypothetical protein